MDIHNADKEKCEEIRKAEILDQLNKLNDAQNVMLKVTIPTVTNTYKALIEHPRVVRVVALSGSYSTDVANEKQKENDGLIARFSRALSQDLDVNQSEEQFDAA